MNDEQRKILDMVEQGIITSEDAARLLKALDDSCESTSTAQPVRQAPPVQTSPEQNAPAQEKSGLGKLARDIRSAALETAKLALKETEKQLKRSFGDLTGTFPENGEFPEMTAEQMDEDFQAARENPKEYPPMEGELTELRIKWLRGNVEVRLTDGGQIRVTEYSRQPVTEDQAQTRLTWEDGELWITWVTQPEKMLQPHCYAKHLLVEIPRSAAAGLEEVEIKNVSGTLRVDDLKAEDMKLSLVSGKMLLSRLGGEDLEVSNVDGLISLQGVEAEDLNVSGVNAAVTLRDVKAEDLNVSGVNGIVTVEEFHAEDATFSTVSGTLTAKGSCDELSLSSVSGEAKAELSRLPEEADANTISGMVALGLPDREEGFTVSFQMQNEGSFDCEFPLTGELGGKSGEGTYGDGEAELNLHTVCGMMNLYRV